jgi:endonuclease/exonuclease/phosphatase family metal-dependent hydrolase
LNADLDISTPPDDVLAKIADLDADLDELLPQQGADNIIVGTWNIRGFGDLTKAWQTPAGGSPLRNFADLSYIARFILRCDVVAVQEVHGNLRGLRYLLKALGEEWSFTLTDVTQGHAGNNERLAFLFNTRRVKLSGLACELVVSIEDNANIAPGALDRQFARTPYAVSFLSGGQTFILVTLHIDYGSSPTDRIPELTEIAQWLAGWAEQEFGWNQNLIALGDFNIDRDKDPLYQAFTSTGLTPAPPLVNLPRTIFDTAKAHHYYDQIAWFTKDEHNRPVLNLNCTTGGNFNFVPHLQGDATLTNLSWHISDHYPLWAELTTPAD